MNQHGVNVGPWDGNLVIIEPGQCNLKDWIKECGMTGRMQSLLIAALRGADADDSPEVKRVTRWIRKQCIKLNNPKSHFMRDCEFVDIHTMIDQDAWQWDRLTSHFYNHLKMALGVIAFYHPDYWVGAKALKAYEDLNEHESIVPLSKTELIMELKDTSPLSRGEWVLQDWVLQITGKMQSTLMCALRGPDTTTDEEVLRVNKWIRWAVMKNLNPDTNYMADREFMSIKTRNEMYPQAWGNLPIHFRHHTREALECLGFMHPDEAVRTRALTAYKDICSKSKGNPETKEVFVGRMQDKPGNLVSTTVQQTNLPQ